MSAGAALLAAREAAARLMVDECTVETVTSVATDEETGAATPTLVPVYEGPCKIQSAEGVERTADVAGATVTVQRYTVHVPVGVFDPAIGQVVTVTASSFDPHLAGRRFRVVALLHKSLASAYRLAVEEAS